MFLIAAGCGGRKSTHLAAPGIRTVRYFLSQSDLVVAGTCEGGVAGVNHMTGHTYCFRMTVDKTLKGSPPASTQIDIYHFVEKYSGDPPTFLDGAGLGHKIHVIAFLKRGLTLTDHPYVTADPYFGLFLHSENMEWQIIQSQGNRTQNNTSDGIRQPADRSPKPSR